MRIVSLIASATEMVHALGLGELQVGRSHECDHPATVLSLPVCTQPRFDVHGSALEIDQRVKSTLATAESVYQVHEEMLAGLQPTHILTQTPCQGFAVSLHDLQPAVHHRLSNPPRILAIRPH